MSTDDDRSCDMALRVVQVSEVNCRKSTMSHWVLWFSC